MSHLCAQTTHLDFQESSPGYYEGILQPSSGPYLNTSSVASDPGAQVCLPSMRG